MYAFQHIAMHSHPLKSSSLTAGLRGFLVPQIAIFEILANFDVLLVYFSTAVRVHWLYGEIASKPFPSSHPCFYSQEPNHRKADFRECAIERHTKVTTDNDCYCCIAEKKPNLFLLGYNEYKYTTKWVYNRLFLSQEIYRFPFFVNDMANAMDIFLCRTIIIAI